MIDAIVAAAGLMGLAAVAIGYIGYRCDARAKRERLARHAVATIEGYRGR